MGLLKRGPPGVGGVAQHAPDGGAVPEGLAGGGGDALRGQPLHQLGHGYVVVGVAAEQLAHDPSIVLDDLIAGVGGIAPPHVAVAVWGAAQHVGHPGPGPVRLAPPGALGDLCPLVLGDHALELDHQLVLGRLGSGALDEADLGAGTGELVDEQRLVGVTAGQAVGRIAQDHVDGDLGGEVPKALEGRADQGGAGVPLVLEDPLGGHVEPPALGSLMERGGLGADRALLALAGRGRAQRARTVGSEGGCTDDLIVRVRKLVTASGCKSRQGSYQEAL